MPTPEELLAQSLTKFQSANRIDGTRASYRKDNPTEYTKVIAYLQGGARPSGVTSDMGMALLLEEDARRALGVVEPPPPPPPPPPPEPEPEPEPTPTPVPMPSWTGLQDVTVSSTVTIQGTVSGKRYIAAAGFIGTMVKLTAGSVLDNCVVDGRGTAQVGVDGGGVGTVRNVKVMNCAYTGFTWVKRFEGYVYGERNFFNFTLSGDGVRQPPGAVIHSHDAGSWGLDVRVLKNSRFEGLILAHWTGKTSGKNQATGFEIREQCTDNYFAHIIANANPGYGVAIANFYPARGPVARNSFGLVECDGAGSGDSDPAMVFSGGVFDSKVGRAVLKNHAFGVTVGEDNSTPNGRVHFDHLEVHASRYGGVRAEVNDGLTINKLILRDVGTVSATVAQGAIHLRGTARNTVILGIDQDVGPLGLKPVYALYVEAGNTGRAEGTMRAWTTAKVKNDAAGFTAGV